MYYVYILHNPQNNVLYIGITNDLSRRLAEHRNEVADSFTKRYHVHKLVYFEEYSSPRYAIFREKQLKRWTRKKKEELIAEKNPLFEDLSQSFL
jgi:putative endonuclease